MMNRYRSLCLEGASIKLVLSAVATVLIQLSYVTMDNTVSYVFGTMLVYFFISIAIDVNHSLSRRRVDALLSDKGGRDG